MALSSRHTQATFVEIYELETPGVQGVTRREDVTTYTDEQRAEYARGFASRIDREFFGVRLAVVTVETLQEF